LIDQLSIYILAGGKSSRMGTDKGLRTLGHQMVIEHILETCCKMSDAVFIVTSNEDYTQFNIPLIRDVIKNAGPAGGIDALMHHTTNELNMVISCDMPFVDVKSMEYMIAQSAEHAITIPMLNNYPEAMFGLYKKECQSQWRQLLLEHTYKMSDLIAHFNPKFVDGNFLQQQNPRLFTNLNTPEDLDKAEQWLTK
jgi:molybdopterin-guanine dinucleotide biosynthesis protein A